MLLTLQRVEFTSDIYTVLDEAGERELDAVRVCLKLAELVRERVWDGDGATLHNGLTGLQLAYFVLQATAA